ncbi:MULTISPECIES: EFR1 family ferrodoxin [unclassified Clostridioides]|uniref:EFR1 family ferrodoxin n=1 Tax=unclassified Clostridioides TaxID=2635829 RepID=UPI001D11C4CD|nr:4Fe-4S binding protein [Clostridioides sp. ES-S-0049-03]MCC0678058.1 4Fe-4S binding protein [Clostridioides sp. ES-W-0018-02]MCC0682207.1 4Fe-4S binding protein [Clostridioides sp. ES-S-0005-03]MCC0697002.1 4Fe-4S binding protein [Clostridioides sp. ES-S-0048-02]MCC0712568.1 4Fe-4S binding protein [Clostridioides sp. ES-W-0017-02]UDN48005.1 EFR1 family ferrodoxin [Clostridioides sp. ES-S-0173-01]
MSSKIYYFSGTGNSLVVSKTLKEMLNENGEVIPLAIHRKERHIDVNEDILIIVFPVYFADVPDIVKFFIDKLNFNSNTHIYAIATCNGVAGHSLFTIDKLLKKKGKKLSAGFLINMPGNALITPPDVEEERLRSQTNRVAEVAKCINNLEFGNIEGKNNLKSHIDSVVLRLVGKNMQIATTKFFAEDNCNGCGTCKRVCPLENISIVDRKPKWGNECERCLACFHWCPKEAINIKKSFLTDRKKYHHPDVTVKDIFLEK